VEKAEMINTLVFVAGINTLLQTWLGTRLPVVIGGSYAFIIPTITIALSTNSSTNVIFLSPRQVSLIPSLISRMHFSNFYAFVFFFTGRIRKEMIKFASYFGKSTRKVKRVKLELIMIFLSHLWLVIRGLSNLWERYKEQLLSLHSFKW